MFVESTLGAVIGVSITTVLVAVTWEGGQLADGVTIHCTTLPYITKSVDYYYRLLQSTTTTVDYYYC